MPLSQTELNIADAPVMMAGGAPAGPAAAAPAEEEEASSGPTMVTVTLKGFKDDSKVKVIKEVKAIMAPIDQTFNLAAAKKFVEGLPKTVKADISPEDANALKEALEAAGGEVEVA